METMTISWAAAAEEDIGTDPSSGATTTSTRFLWRHGVHSLAPLFEASIAYRDAENGEGGVFLYFLSADARPDDDDPREVTDARTMSLLFELVPITVSSRMVFVPKTTFLSDCMHYLSSLRCKPTTKEINAYCRTGAMLVAFKLGDASRQRQSCCFAMVPDSSGARAAQLHKPGVKVSTSIWEASSIPEERFRRSFDISYFMSTLWTTSPYHEVRRRLASHFGFNSEAMNDLLDKIAGELGSKDAAALYLPLMEAMVAAIDENCLPDDSDKILEIAKGLHAEYFHYVTSRETFVQEALKLSSTKQRQQRQFATGHFSPCVCCGHVNTSFPYPCRRCSEQTKKDDADELQKPLPTARPTSSDEVAKVVERANALAAAQKSLRKRKGVQTTSLSVSSHLPRRQQTPTMELQPVAAETPKQRKHQQSSTSSAGSKKKPEAEAQLPTRSEREATALAFMWAMQREETTTTTTVVADGVKSSSSTRRQRKKQPQGDRKLAQKMAAGEIIFRFDKEEAA